MRANVFYKTSFFSSQNAIFTVPSTHQGLVTSVSFGQGVQISKDPFNDTQPLPFAPAPKAPESVMPMNGLKPLGMEPIGSLKILPLGQPQGPGSISPTLPVAAPEGQKWELQVTDVTYSNAFKRWATKVGYRVKWDATRHVLIDGLDTLDGSFESVVEKALSSPGVQNSDYPLEVCFYPNTPPLARITRRGEQTNDCK
jgi:Toxin co-regulated pilus biosynthesis protein Q